MKTDWMEGLEGRRLFSVSVSATAVMVPIDVIPIDMGTGSGDGSSSDPSTGDGGSTDSGSVDTNPVDGGSTDGGSADGTDNSNGDPTADPIATDPGNNLDGTVQIMGLGSVGPAGLSAKSGIKTGHTHHHHHVRSTAGHAITAKTKHPFSVRSLIGAHTRMSLLRRQG